MTNIIKSKPVLCDSHLLAWEYNRIFPTVTGNLGVFRPSFDAVNSYYTLVHSTAVPTQPVGRQILKLPEMLPVKAGDVIGMYFTGDGRHFIANVQPGQMGSSEELDLDTVILCGRRTDFEEGDVIEGSSCSEIPRAYALRAILYQNWTLGMLF